jgi:phytoene synthase
MDIHPRRYRTLEELREYSYRVASVVGGWLTELFGIHDPWVLERAFALGHAMQLTNILRDVGEDLRVGRLYLPEDLLESNGVDRDFLEAKSRSSSPMFPGYRKVLEELMASAEEDYRRAFEAIPLLPGFFQGPVAVAARVYEGIHEEIRRNGFDNLTRRARTSLPRKLLLGMVALKDLARFRRQRDIGDENKRVDGARLALEKSREAAA